MTLIYEPAEDSYLMQEVLEKNISNQKIKVLEIWAGSGILLQVLLNINIKDVMWADINKNAVKYCSDSGFNCIYYNLFSKIRNNKKFDLIIFNPPYLPKDKDDFEDKESKLATTGGKWGSEVINRFLKQAKSRLTKNGKIFLLTSSLTERINWMNYKKRILVKKKLFFEELYVWELKL